MIDAIHRAIDRRQILLAARGRPDLGDTWRYERAAGLLLETWLLAGCALPLVTGWRSLATQLALGALRLVQAELGRERASIEGRAREDGQIRRDLPEHKVDRLEHLGRLDTWVTWTWPAATAAVLAIESGHLTVVALLGVLATLLRACWARVLLPAWRESRRAWRASCTSA